MKKIAALFAFMLLALGSSKAQGSLTIRDEQMNMASLNGQTLTFFLPDTDQLGYPSHHIYYVDFFNGSANTVTYKVKRTIIQQVSGSTVSYCNVCGNGLCFTGPFSSSYTLNPGDSCSWDFQYSAGIGAIYGTTTVLYTVYNVNNANDSTAVTVNYVITPTGITTHQKADEEVLSEATPNPATTSFSVRYDLGSQPREARIVVHNLVGETLLEETLTTTKGTLELNTARFEPGIYFFTLYTNGSASVTRRVVITR